MCLHIFTYSICNIVRKIFMPFLQVILIILKFCPERIEAVFSALIPKLFLHDCIIVQFFCHFVIVCIQIYHNSQHEA